MGYYTADCKNLERNSARKRTSAGRGTLGVSSRVYLDTQAMDIVGIDMWLRDFRGEPMLQVSSVDNGRIGKGGEMLFDGSIEEFVELLRKERA